jgi:hypothetical protein
MSSGTIIFSCYFSTQECSQNLVNTKYDMYKVIQYSSRKLQEPSVNGAAAVPTSED